MMLITGGDSFIEMAKTLYQYKTQIINCGEVYDSSAFKKLDSEKDSIIDEFKQNLKDDELKLKLERLCNDIDPEESALWSEFYYTRGFLDGINAMTAIICKLNGKAVKSLIVDLLEDGSKNEPVTGKSIMAVQNFTTEIKEVIAEIQALEEFDGDLLQGRGA